MVKRIEICGGIASGKTTLAGLLEKQGYTAIYERFGDNPFLNQFYQMKEMSNAFETEMVFALLHYNQIKQGEKSALLVSDYSMLQDYCYALQNLQIQEKEIFKNVYKYLTDSTEAVDLIIYLKCGIDCLRRRIAQRGRDMESDISEEYLRKHIEILEEEIGKEKNVLVIDSEKYDFRFDDKETVLSLITKRKNELERTV